MFPRSQSYQSWVSDLGLPTPACSLSTPEWYPEWPQGQAGGGETSVPGKGTREQVKTLEQGCCQPELCLYQVARSFPVLSFGHEKPFFLARGREELTDLTNPRPRPIIMFSPGLPLLSCFLIY